MINIDLENDTELEDVSKLTLAEQYRELEKKYEELSVRCSSLEKEKEELSIKYDALQQAYEELKQSKSKAGRKPNDEKWTARYQAFARMKQEGKSRQEIQQELDMSRATYFRYQKIYTQGPGVSESAAESSGNVSAASSSFRSESIQTKESKESPAKKDPDLTESTDTSVAADSSLPSSSPNLPERTLELSQEFSELTAKTEELSARAEKVLSAQKEDLILDPESGEYVTPEGLKRRKKLAEIRARRAAEEERKKQQAESGEGEAADSKD